MAHNYLYNIFRKCNFIYISILIFILLDKLEGLFLQNNFLLYCNFILKNNYYQ